MPHSIVPSTVDKKLTLPQDFDYIEGTIKKFPEVLKTQIDSYDGSKFAATRRISRGRDRQSLTWSVHGRQVKFVMRDDSDEVELPTGRFWYSDGQQIVVVSLPDKNAAGLHRYVVVRHTRYKSWFVSPSGWTGMQWKVWRPGDNSGEYYENIPEYVVRLRAPETPPGNRETGEVTTVTTKKNEQTTQEQTLNPAMPKPSHTKRQSSLLDTMFQPHKRKRIDKADSTSLTAHKEIHDQAGSGAGEVQPSVEPSKDGPSSIPQQQKFEYSSDTSEDTDTIPAVIKQEAPHTNPDDAAAEPSDVSGYTLALDTTVKEQDDETTIASPELVSSPAATSVLTDRTTVIDLTTEREQDVLQTVPRHYPNVVFVDEHGQTQRQMRFDKCNTAKDLFEEACTWDAASKETNMLEVKITGCKPARIRKYNQDHFEKKILRPLRTMMANRIEGQVITLVVRKYM